LKVEPGEFFFGHFTAANNGALISANETPRGLMIELIAWDPAKGVFNFYELIGNGQKGEWVYRGNSLDILADISHLHRQPDPQRPPQFGERLRCSGCHSAGGPIMKELVPPHNDWWTSARPRLFGNVKPDATLTAIFQGLVDAEAFARGVTAGSLLLENSSRFQEAKSALSLQEQLRPLFCPVELNLESDVVPFDEHAPTITVSSAFFVDARLSQRPIQISRTHYEAALTQLNSSFPKTRPQRHDADHAWLTPVKASADIRAIDGLVNRKVIDREFVTGVLAVGLTNPVFSDKRCRLLRLVPAQNNSGWMEAFRAALKASPDEAAQELLRNLIDPEQRAEFHQKQATEFVQQCQPRLEDSTAVFDLVRLLAQRRAEVFESEISQNPHGQILEPRRLPGGGIDVTSGFKIVFPVVPSVQPFQARPKLRLTEACRVVTD
jgi:hypothetical protein